MSAPTFAMALRLRALQTLSTAVGMALVILMVGSLFPAVGNSLGKLNLPTGVAELLGGADYGTIEGWMRSEIGAIYGPLVIAITAIGGAAASTAGEEEAGILALLLAYPVQRSRLLLGKAAAVAAEVVIVAAGTFVGLIVGVAVAGGGVPFGNLAALSLHLAFFGFAVGALALAIAATTGRKGLAIAGASGFALLGFFAYYNFINLSQSWVSSGRIGAAAALFVTHGFAFALAVSLLWWREHGASRVAPPRRRRKRARAAVRPGSA